MKIGKRSPQFLMSLRDTPNHEKTRRMGGAKRNPSALFVAELPARAGKRIDRIIILRTQSGLGLQPKDNKQFTAEAHGQKILTAETVNAYKRPGENAKTQ
jgi:hypothetical protein